MRHTTLILRSSVWSAASRTADCAILPRHKPTFLTPPLASPTEISLCAPRETHSRRPRQCTGLSSQLTAVFLSQTQVLSKAISRDSTMHRLSLPLPHSEH